jgi:hypothetical protein
MHLKYGGCLTAIIYDSWLYADYGLKFKELLTKDYNLKEIVHFKEGAFNDVYVGATVLLITANKQKPIVDYYLFKSPEDMPKNCQLMDETSQKITLSELKNFHQVEGNFLDFSSDFFTEMKKISNSPLKRGRSAMVNKFFIFKNKRFSPYTTKFVKNVAKIKKFELGKEFDYVLTIPKEKIEDKNLLKYLQEVKNTVKSEENKYKTLYNKIDNNEFWYHIPESKGGNFLFNYYMRNNINFIYNRQRFMASDNFYNLNVETDILEHFCILNSSFY